MLFRSFVKLKELHCVSEVIRHRHDMNPYAKELLGESDMRFCTRQDNDVTLSQFSVIHNIDVDTIIAIQGCELLGFQAVGVRHRDSRATQRDELCNDTGSGDARTDDSYSSGAHW